MKKLVIIGSQGHARSCIDVCEKQGEYEIMGLIDPYRSEDEMVMGYPVIGKIEDANKFPKNIFYFIAIGDNCVRRKVFEQLPFGARIATLIHPSAQIGSYVTVGYGTVIMAGAVINCNTRIGDYSIINTNSSIDHDCSMDVFSSIAPNVATGGAVTIGAYSAVSIGATVRGHLNIGSNTVIGAASLLLHDAPSNSVMYGVPAKVIRERKFGDKYL